MSIAVIVQLPAVPGGDAAWVVAGAPGAAPATGSLASLAEALAAQPRRLPLVALLPASSALLTAVTVPPRQQRQLLQALPYLVEEHLAGDIESFHVVPGARLADGRLHVGAVPRALVRDALAGLAAAGLDPDFLTVDAALLLPAEGARILLDGADSLLATAAGVTLAFHEDDLAALGESLPASGPVRVQVTSEESLVPARAFEASALAGEGAAPVAIDTEPLLRLAALATALPNAAALKRLANFRQGEFAFRGDGSGALGFDWRPLAWLAASWVLLVVGYQLAAGITDGRAADAVQAGEVSLYRQLFPGANNVPKPRAQMEGQLRATASAGGGFVGLVAETSSAIAGLNAAAPVLQPRHLGWDDASGKLQVDIVARSIDDLEKLRRALEGRGLSVDIGSGVAQDGGYKARVNVGRAS